jgi:large subunit ribosomal protein L28
MARKCELTGKGPTTGNLVSHSNIKTRTRWLPNLQSKRYRIPELGQILTLRLSTAAIRTIDKVGGISNAVRKAKDEQLSEQLLKVKRSLARQARAAATAGSAK